MNAYYCGRQFPQELITYGGNGAVFSNRMQLHATMHHLKELEPNQVLSTSLIRRARAGNENAVATVREIAERYPDCKPFLPGLMEEN